MSHMGCHFPTPQCAHEGSNLDLYLRRVVSYPLDDERLSLMKAPFMSDNSSCLSQMSDNGDPGGTRTHINPGS